MLSRITIEVDFDNGNMPIIQIDNKNSDDVRDQLVARFLQSLQHSSRWCTINFQDEFVKRGDTGKTYRWTIKPVTPDKYADEIKLMRAEMFRFFNLEEYPVINALGDAAASYADKKSKLKSGISYKEAVEIAFLAGAKYVMEPEQNISLKP